ncbi:MAG: DUF475 domain-containing protein [Deinococcaceae bacterium]
MIVREFGFSIGLSILCLIGAFAFGISHGDLNLALKFLFIALILGVMEVSLSFDNAVVNASVLKNMSPVWQQRFLTWGIFIAVFGMRFIFPILIVSLVSGLGFGEVLNLALNNGEKYGEYLEKSEVAISAFGGTFLSLVFFHYLLDPEKDVHWFGWLEERLAAIGKLETVQVLITGVLLLLCVHFLVPEHEQYTALLAGVVGILTYIFVDGLGGLFDTDKLTTGAASAGLASFIYLEVLDASFSLDGVIGAFAITKEVVIIAAGLTIGAAFVRSLTLLLVHQGTLAQYRYLEHGAHYGIGALAAIMLLSMGGLHIPEMVTGLIGVAFIGASIYASLLYNKRQALSQ